MPSSTTKTPAPYEKVVDRLLASPRYGERWGRHWMDVWRYSDWAGWGQQVRDSQPHIWHWRDWIVESLNEDKPYDRMVVEMLAADEDRPDDLDALRATGYLARNFKLLSREKWMQDVVDHTGQAFLGVTIGCARCHDHMYDPILQKDYYQVRAIFEPHQVRIDKVPGVLDTAKDGIPRAYDAQIDAKTLLFVRGDDRYPTGDPLSPGVPESLGGRFEVKPVSLPLTAIAPDRRKDVIYAQLDATFEALARAEVALDRLDTNIEGRRENRAGALRRRGGPGATSRPESRSSRPRRWPIGERRGRRSGPRPRSRRRLDSDIWPSPRPAGPRRWRGRRVGRPRRPSGPRPTRPTPMPSRPWSCAREDSRQPPSTSYTPPTRTVYPATSTGRRLAFARWIADRVQPADGPGGRQPPLGPPLRPGDRADGE